MQCHFSVEIYSPEGIGKIADHLGKCRLQLYVHKSGYNGKEILRSKHGGEIEWAMDSSDSSIMFASGYVDGGFDRANLLLGDLAIALVASGYPHQIKIDDDKGQQTNSSSYLWSKYESS